MSQEKDWVEQDDLLSKEKGKAVEAMNSQKLLQPKRDVCNLVYIIFLLHGIGTLMPWNMFINANKYFQDYKLQGNDTTIYRDYFLNFVGFTAQIPNFLLSMLNVFCHCGGSGNVGKRIVFSIVTITLIFILTIIMAMLDTSTWKPTFFWITMASVVVINSATGVYQNSMYGVAAFLPMKYTNAVIFGSNISGTITSVLNIISIIVAPDPRTAAIYYFMAAVFILLICFDTYLVLPLLGFYRHYEEQAAISADIDGQSERQGSHLEYLFFVFRRCWIQHLGVFFVFFVTLACFPAVMATVVSTDPESFIVPGHLFSAICCFLVFNVMAAFGNLCTEFVQFPGPRFVWIPIVLRAVFIPFFLFCNASPGSRGDLPVIFGDYLFLAGGILFGFTSGYLSSLAMMYAPRAVEPAYSGTAGMLAAFFLVFGIVSGVIVAIPLQKILVQS